MEAAISESAQTVLSILVGLCLGALVGLERQVAQEESGGEKDFPGVRTLAFTALVGSLAVLLARELGPWIAVALFLAFATFLVLRYRYDASERGDPGYTTEVASLCTFAVGALAQSGRLLVATVVTIVMVALLRSKRALHRAGELLSPQDMEVLIRFLVLSGIVLPLLPDEPYDPFGVLRPRDVWRMVVLISGLSFLGYVLMRVGASQRSQLASGLLGGLVSSTAATLAYARSARSAADARPFEARVALATAASFVRVSIVIAVVAPLLLPRVAPPLASMCVVALGLAGLLARPGPDAEPAAVLRNPLTLRLAFAFAAVYATVLVLAAAAGELFAERGTYAVTALAASVGADAPVISLGRLASAGRLDAEGAAFGIVVVTVAATLGKLGILLAVGRSAVVRACGALVAVALTGGAWLVRW